MNLILANGVELCQLKISTQVTCLLIHERALAAKWTLETLETGRKCPISPSFAQTESELLLILEKERQNIYDGRVPR